MTSVSVDQFLEEKFREYYRKNSHRIMPPEKFEKREFGFIYFKNRVMVRHRQFTSVSDLRKFITDSAPSDVYYSTAYYSKPEEEMEQKGWLGADLVFDIDADHIPTPCKETHDQWTCKKCGRSGKGGAPQVCPSCNGDRFDDRTWICGFCIKEAKNETLKLADMLIEDYGFSRKDLKVFFTGHRGYHVHVMSDTIQSLSSDERKEIVDYVLGIGIDLDEIDVLQENSVRPSLPESLEETRGWKRRIIHKLIDVFGKGTPEELVGLGVKRSVAKMVTQERGPSLQYEDVRNMIYGLESRTMAGRSWEKVINRTIENCSARVDTVVTTDVHRLIRTKETLNGRTGMRTVEIGVDNIESFDPFNQALGITDGETTIEVDEAPQFNLGGTTFGPYRKQRATLPAEAAVLLICKGKARPVIANV